jgi:hypothetical protein
MVVVLERSDRVAGARRPKDSTNISLRYKCELSVCKQTVRQTLYVISVYLGPTPFGPAPVPEPRPMQDS